MALINGFFYVYILLSAIDDGTHYTGLTRDLRFRLGEHNRGNFPHTMPKEAVAARNRNRVQIEQIARRFERYLKTGFRACIRTATSLGDFRSVAP